MKNNKNIVRKHHYFNYNIIILSVFFFVLIISGCSYLLTGKHEDRIYGEIHHRTVLTEAGYFIPIPEYYDTYRLYLDMIPQRVTEPLIVNDPGYHELLIESCIDTAYMSEILQFVILNKERGTTEWGLPPWVPPSFTPDSVTLPVTTSLTIVYPHSYPENLSFPCIILLDNENEKSFFNKYCSMPAPLSQVPVKRGFGSVVSNVYPAGPLLSFSVDSLTVNSDFTIETDVVWTIKEGILTGDQVWETGSRIHITGDIIIDPGNSLTIGEGSIILLDENVNIFIRSILTVNDLSEEVVVFTSLPDSPAWGGIIISGEDAIVTINGSIFTNSGGNINMGHGHSDRQPLFLIEDNASFTCDNIYIVDNKGQAFGGESSVIEVHNSLVQKCVTGGQFTNCQLTIIGSCFSDFPEDSSVYINNGIYISGNSTVAFITDSRFMYTKDDGIDSGGSGGGDITISNCIVDSCFHEGFALSSKGPSVKNHILDNNFITRCGQGLELGYSSENHEVYANHCLFYDNFIGIRYGDNYKNEYNGRMYIRNSISINNTKDIWNMKASDWKPSINGIVLQNSFFYSCQEIYGNQENLILEFDDSMHLLPSSPGYQEGTDGENIGLW